MKKIILFLFLTFIMAPYAYAVYCGNLSVSGVGGTGGGGTGGGVAALPCHFWVAATGGNDGNAGTSSATPFATLEKAQTSMQGVVSSTAKVVCLKAGSGGTYNRTQPLTLTASDNNETWEFDPASGVNTADLDGGGTVDLIIINGANNVTIDGIKFTNPLGAALHDTGNIQSTGIVVENNDMCCNHGSIADGFEDGFPNMLSLDNTKNTQLVNNYVHNTIHGGIGLLAFSAGESTDGGLIANNVVIATCQQITDCNSISVDMANTGPNGGRVTIQNNFIRDIGQPGVGGIASIYLDDYSSNIIVKGNVVGPPVNGWTGSSSRQDGQCFEIHNGSNNTISDNICDLGSTGKVNEALYFEDGNVFGNGMIGNVYTNNINVSDFAGSSTSNPVICQGCAYVEQGSGNIASNYTIQNNAYHNYGGTAEPTNGLVQGDTNPQHLSAAALACSGYLYTLASGSQAFAAPVSFPAIVGGWGPPGFIIPTSTNFSCH